MKQLSSIAWFVASLSAGVAQAQVKDASGNVFRAGEPSRALRDFDGGTIMRGRPAHCRLHTGPVQPCTFFPRNGDGSFAIEVAGRAYYAGMIAPDTIMVDYDNGARMVPQGRFTRSKRDRACWVRRDGGRICVD